MFETLALVLLALAFGVLLWTFVWVAKLLTHRAKVKERAKKKVIAKKEIAEELAGEEEEEDEEPEMVRARIEYRGDRAAVFVDVGDDPVPGLIRLDAGYVRV